MWHRRSRAPAIKPKRLPTRRQTTKNVAGKCPAAFFFLSHRNANGHKGPDKHCPMPENKMDSCKVPDGYRRRENVFGDMSARIYHEKASGRLDFNGTLRAKLDAVIKVGMLPV